MKPSFAKLAVSLNLTANDATILAVIAKHRGNDPVRLAELLKKVTPNARIVGAFLLNQEVEQCLLPSLKEKAVPAMRMAEYLKEWATNTSRSHVSV